MLNTLIIGTGTAGLTCAQQLTRSGQTPTLIDKSKGLGGRLATRRLNNTHADHGVCYLKPKSESFGRWIDALVDDGILRIWTDRIHHLDRSFILQEPIKIAPCYASPQGATAIAKHLAKGLTIIPDRRVTHLELIPNGWRVTATNGTDQDSIDARQIVFAIPPAQVLELIESIAPIQVVNPLKTVEFAPSITAIATYPAELLPAAEALSWRGIQCDDAELGWIGLDSSKQLKPTKPVIVVQSSAEFADRYFDESDLNSVGQRLLDRAANLADWIAKPELVQVHRWRYAFAKTPLKERFVDVGNGLYLCGDWCGGDRVESAYFSGLAIAAHLARKTPDSP
jgi:renalase